MAMHTNSVADPQAPSGPECNEPSLNGKMNDKTPLGSTFQRGTIDMMGFLYAVCAIEGADSQLFPASFRAMEVSLGLTPSRLAFLSMGQSFALFAFTPVWGSLADSGYSRKRLLAGGAFSWGALTLLLSLVSSYPAMVGLRILNGMALGSLGPISQSLIVDYSAATERGYYFGCVQFATNIGHIVCAVTTTTISMRLILGYEGWRAAFAFVANLSILLSFAIFLFMPEPPRRQNATVPSIAGELSKVMRYLRIPTFCILVAQGMFGSIPWSAMHFMTFYFQYIGVSDFRASFLSSLSMLGAAFGGIVGGVVGDRLALWSPTRGRAITAQISVASGIPLVAAILSGNPGSPGAFYPYCVLMFVFGLMAAWCSAGVNRPILAEIVDECDRASVFGWLCTIDGTFSALLGAPMVGILAEQFFGYHPTQQLISAMPEAQRMQNAAALAHALFWVCSVPWLICLTCYGFLHITYVQDIHKNPEGEPTPALTATSRLVQ